MKFNNIAKSIPALAACMTLCLVFSANVLTAQSYWSIFLDELRSLKGPPAKIDAEKNYYITQSATDAILAQYGHRDQAIPLSPDVISLLQQYPSFYNETLFAPLLANSMQGVHNSDPYLRTLGMADGKVLLQNGEFILSRTVLPAAEPGSPLELVIDYSSYSQYNGVLGLGWTHNFNLRLERTTDDLPLLRLADNAVVEFELVSGNDYQSKYNDADILSGTFATGFTLTSATHGDWTFDTHGLPTQLQLAPGDVMTLSHSATEKEIIGSYARSLDSSLRVVNRDYRLDSVTYQTKTLQFFYNDDPGAGDADAHGRIRQVEEQQSGSTLRTVTFLYDSGIEPAGSVGDLLAVTDVNGTTHSFGYTLHNSSATFRRLLETYEEVPGDSNSIIQNRYYNYFDTTPDVFGDLPHPEFYNRNAVTHQKRKHWELVASDYQYVVKDTYTFDYLENATTIAIAGTQVVNRSETYTFKPDNTTGETTIAQTIEVPQADGQDPIQLKRQSVIHAGQGKLVGLTLYNGGSVTEATTTDGTNTILTSNLQLNSDETHTVTLTYNDSNQLIEEVVAQTIGAITTVTRTIVYDYTGDQLDTATIDGKVRTYQYNGNDQLSSIIEPDGKTTSYTYHAQGYVLTTTAPDGSVTHFNADGSVDHLVSANALLTTRYVYTDGQLTEKRLEPAVGEHRIFLYREGTSPDQRECVQVDPNGGNPIEHLLTTITYNQLGLPTAATNALDQTVYFIYDSVGRLHKVQLPNAQGELSTFEFNYDRGGRLTQLIDPINRINEYQYDSLNRSIRQIKGVGFSEARIVDYAYDALNQVIHESFSNANSSQQSENYFYYNSMGTRTGVNWQPGPTNDPQPGLETPEYWVFNNNNLPITHVTSKNGAIEHKVEYTYTGTQLHEKKFIDADGTTVAATWTHHYNGNSLDYIEKVPGNNKTYFAIVVDNATIGTETHYQSIPVAGTLSGNWWDTASNVASKKVYNAFGDSIEDSAIDGPTQLQTYDSLGRLDSYQENGSIIKYQYNEVGVLTQITTADDHSILTLTPNAYNTHLVQTLNHASGATETLIYDTALQQTGHTGSHNTIGQRINYDYNGVGDLSKIQPQAGATLSIVYNHFGYPEKILNAINQQLLQHYTYDASGNLTQLSGDQAFNLNITYDAMQQVDTVTDALGQTIDFGYDENHNFASIDSPQGEAWNYDYDETGALIAFSIGATNIATINSDDYGRITAIDYATGTANDVSITYNEATNIIAISQGGALETEWLYDSAGQLTLYQQQSVNRMIHYLYNPDGTLERLQIFIIGQNVTTDTPEREIIYTYTDSNRISTIQDSALSTAPIRYTWDTQGDWLSRIITPSYQQQVFHYDDHGRLESTYSLGNDGSIIDRQDYTLGDYNQPTAVTIAAVTYPLDYILKSDSHLPTFPPSHLPTQKAPHFAIPPTFRLTSPWQKLTDDFILTHSQVANQPTYSTTHGRVEAYNSHSFNYDQAGRLLSVPGQFTAAYDSLGRCIERVEGSTTRRFLLNGRYPIAEYDENNTLRHTYTRSPIALPSYSADACPEPILAMKSATEVTSFFYDAWGNVTQLLDSNNTSSAQYTYGTYQPWELPTVSGSLTQPYQFQGHDTHAGTGLVWNGQSFYASALRRNLGQPYFALTLPQSLSIFAQVESPLTTEANTRLISHPDPDNDKLDNWLEALLTTATDSADSDNDTLSDYDEILLGTEATDPDTDGDQLFDAWELLQGLDPNNPSDATTQLIHQHNGTDDPLGLEIFTRLE